MPLITTSIDYCCCRSHPDKLFGAKQASEHRSGSSDWWNIQRLVETILPAGYHFCYPKTAKVNRTDQIDTCDGHAVSRRNKISRKTTFSSVWTCWFYTPWYIRGHYKHRDCYLLWIPTTPFPDYPVKCSVAKQGNFGPRYTLGLYASESQARNQMGCGGNTSARSHADCESHCG